MLTTVHRKGLVVTSEIRRHVSKVRLILVILICASPAILLRDGLITQGLVAGIVAVALVITGRTMRPSETKFLVSIVRPLAPFAAVPALWVLVQVLPLRVLAHPIWKSAEAALGHPVAGGISVDPGASVIALGEYLSAIAVIFLSAAVAVDRQRAKWILFALTAAVTAIALIMLTDDLLFHGFGLPRSRERRRSTASVWEQLSPAQRASAPSSATRPVTQTPSDRCRFCFGPS